MFTRMFAATVLVAGLLTGTATAGTDSVRQTSGTTGTTDAIEEVTGFGPNPGNLRMFRFVPDGLPTGRPVVVALHGCTQDASGYGSNAGWIPLARQWRFAVVLPEQRLGNNLNRCFNWFERADTDRGVGEAESIAQMVRHTVAGTNADPARVYATGLSAGGGMTAVMLAAYPDLFAGGGIVAGLPYRCATTVVDAFTCMNPGRDRTPAQWGDRVRAASAHTGPWPAVSIWHGDADTTVTPANQSELVEQWTDVHGISQEPTETDTVAGYPHAVYRDGNRAAVETYTITGMSHGQPVDPGSEPGQCGSTAPYMLDTGICAAWHLGTGWRLPD